MIFFSLSVDSQDTQMVSSAFVTTYTTEYTGTFGQPAPNARYHVHTVLFGARKYAWQNPACKDTCASVQGSVCHRRSAGNHWNFQLFQWCVASHPDRDFFPFFFLFSAVIIPSKHSIVYSKTMLQNTNRFTRTCTYPSPNTTFCFEWEVSVRGGVKATIQAILSKNVYWGGLSSVELCFR